MAGMATGAHATIAAASPTNAPDRQARLREEREEHEHEVDTGGRQQELLMGERQAERQFLESGPQHQVDHDRQGDQPHEITGTRGRDGVYRRAEPEDRDTEPRQKQRNQQRQRRDSRDPVDPRPSPCVETKRRRSRRGIPSGLPRVGRSRRDRAGPGWGWPGWAWPGWGRPGWGRRWRRRRLLRAAPRAPGRAFRDVVATL